ncbi:hypothetical protein J1614_004084 [Plenodomus biglobosus]|nr:hypothetical protein J1614_004084 [Plenodomus biglobosus]
MGPEGHQWTTATVGWPPHSDLSSSQARQAAFQCESKWSLGKRSARLSANNGLADVRELEVYSSCEPCLVHTDTHNRQSFSLADQHQDAIGYGAIDEKQRARTSKIFCSCDP